MAIQSQERPGFKVPELSNENERIANLISLAGEIYLKALPKLKYNLDPVREALPIQMDDGRIIIITDMHLAWGNVSREGYSISTWSFGGSQKPFEIQGAVLGEGFKFKDSFKYVYSKTPNVDSVWLDEVEKALEKANENLNMH